MTAGKMKRTNASAVVRSNLAAIEDEMRKGSTRQVVMEWINDQFDLNMNIKAFELALYRARKNVEMNGLCNPISTGLHNPESSGLHNPKDDGLHNPNQEPNSENIAKPDTSEFKTIEDDGRSHLTQSDFSKSREESESEMESVRKHIAQKKGFL